MDLSAYPKPSAVAATINTSPVTETITREGLFPPFQFAISVKKKKDTANSNWVVFGDFGSSSS
jgi:hypothetical protein